MSNTKLIVNANVEDINDFRYREPRPYPSGRGKTAKIIGKGGQYQNFQIPKMMTWGINKNENDSGVSSYSMNLQFPGFSEQTPQQKRLLDMMKARDERHINSSIENSVKWFGKKRSKESIEENYVSSLKYPKLNKGSEERDYSKPPAMRVKIPCYDGFFKCTIFDVNGKTLFNEQIQQDMDTREEREELLNHIIPKTSEIVPIIQSNGLWIVQNNFGETLQLTQAVVRPPTRIDNNVCQIVLDENELQDMKSSKKNTGNEEPKQEEKMNVVVEDSDDEEQPVEQALPQDTTEQSSDENDDEEEDEKPKARKRVVRKKK